MINAQVVILRFQVKANKLLHGWRSRTYCATALSHLSGALRPNPPWGETLAEGGRHVVRTGGISLSSSPVIVSVLSKDLTLHKRNNLDMQMCIPN